MTFMKSISFVVLVALSVGCRNRNQNPPDFQSKMTGEWGGGRKRGQLGSLKTRATLPHRHLHRLPVGNVLAAVAQHHVAGLELAEYLHLAVVFVAGLHVD